MKQNSSLHENSPPFEPVRNSSNGFEHRWMTVEQAVVFCAERGLNRTPKTIRKWAERSSGLADGEVVARKEDTPYGNYRWQIDVTSLARKVEEELSVRNTNQPEPVRPGANAIQFGDVEKANKILIEPTPSFSEQVQTGGHRFEPTPDQRKQETQGEPGVNPTEPVRTGAERSELLQPSELELVLDEVRERMGDKDKEIAFLRDQLSEAQAEIGRRAASTDEALKTIDRVVRSFEMQAEANRALALGGAERPEPYPEATKPISFTPANVDNPTGHMDVRRVQYGE